MNTKQTVNITYIQHLDNADLTAEFAPSLNREGVSALVTSLTTPTRRRMLCASAWKHTSNLLK